MIIIPEQIRDSLRRYVGETLISFMIMFKCDYRVVPKTPWASEVVKTSVRVQVIRFKFKLFPYAHLAKH